MGPMFLKRMAVLATAASVGMAAIGCGMEGPVGTDGSAQVGVGAGTMPDSPAAADTEQEDLAAGKGRYIEKIVLEAEDLEERSHLFRLADSQLLFLNYMSGQRYRAVDGGDTWEPIEDEAFASYTDEHYGITAAVSRDGTIAMINMVKKKGQEELEHPDYDHLLNIYHTDGTVENIPVALSDSRSRLRELVFAEDGTLFAYANVSNTIFEVDIESGNVRELFDLPEILVTMCCRDGILLCAGDGGTYLYDIESGSLTEDGVLDEFIEKAYDGVSWSGAGFSAYPFLGEDGSVYVAGRKGLYRHVINGNVMEQVIDGSISSLGDPSRSIMAAIENDDQEFFAAFSDGTVVRYTFDADVSAVPESKLTIYSLQEDAMVRQAVASYHAADPDMYLDYEVGMDSDGITREDALKKLNTRLLSGEGPDVIVLDGMDIDTYVEKGVLMDISDVVSGVDERTALYMGLIEPFYQGDALYAVPTQFRIPMIGGHEGVLEGIKDLSSMADMVERAREEYPDADLLWACSDSGIMRRFLPVCAPSWKTADGQLDEGKIRDFLQQVKRIYDAQMNGTPQEDILAYQQNMRDDNGKDLEEDVYFLSMQSAEYYYGESPFFFGELMSALTYMDMLSVPRLAGFEDTIYQKMPGQSADVYHPTAIVGINAAAQDPEQAREFVRLMLSTSVQDAQHVGLPINRASLQQMFAYDKTDLGDDGGLWYMSSTDKDGKQFDMVIYPADLEDVKALEQLIGELDTPYLSDVMLEEVVLAEGGKYLNGHIELDAAVKAIMDSAAIYMAE